VIKVVKGDNNIKEEQPTDSEKEQKTTNNMNDKKNLTNTPLSKDLGAQNLNSTNSKIRIQKGQEKPEKVSLTELSNEYKNISNKGDEEPEIKEIEDYRKAKKEEWKKKEEEVKVKQKNDREVQEKAAENQKKQREYERRNVTTDVNGNIIFFKQFQNDKGGNDFVNPRSDIKHKGEILGTLNNKIDQGNKDSRKNNDKKLAEKNLNKRLEHPVYASLSHSDNPQKLAITPAGSSYNLIVPEVGVTIIENGQSKYGGGGREFHKAFKKYSKYDYQNYLKDSSNTYYNSTMKDANIDNINSDGDLPDKKDTLPGIGFNAYNTKSEGLGTSIKSQNSQTNNIKVNTKLGSLKNTLESLDQIVEFEEHENESVNNANFFKNTKMKDKLDDYQKSLEDINKFNFSIIKNAQWGANNSVGLNQKHDNITKYKPDLKEIEREVGKNIVQTKLPRSRVFSYVKSPLEMNATASNMNSIKSNKLSKTFRNENEKKFNKTVK
jgi:hypothetical protein